MAHVHVVVVLVVVPVVVVLVCVPVVVLVGLPWFPLQCVAAQSVPLIPHHLIFAWLSRLFCLSWLSCLFCRSALVPLQGVAAPVGPTYPPSSLCCLVVSVVLLVRVWLPIRFHLSPIISFVLGCLGWFACLGCLVCFVGLSWFPCRVWLPSRFHLSPIISAMHRIGLNCRPTEPIMWNAILYGKAYL